MWGGYKTGNKRKKQTNQNQTKNKDNIFFFKCILSKYKVKVCCVVRPWKKILLLLYSLEI